MTHLRQGFHTTAPPPSGDGVDRKRYRVLSDRLNAALCSSVKQVLDQLGVGDLYKEDAASAELTELCERIMGQLFRTDYNRKHGPVFNGAKAVTSKAPINFSTMTLEEIKAIPERVINEMSLPQLKKLWKRQRELQKSSPEHVERQRKLKEIEEKKRKLDEELAQSERELDDLWGFSSKETKASTTLGWKQRLSRLSVDSTAPVLNTRYLRGNGVVFYLYALVTSKTGENLPGVSAGYTKPVSKVPPSIASELPKPMLVVAEEAAARGELWYISVGTDKEGKGWVWGKKNGAKEAAAVQEVLSFLLQFTSRKSVNGSMAFYVEIANNFLGL